MNRAYVKVGDVREARTAPDTEKRRRGATAAPECEAPGVSAELHNDEEKGIRNAGHPVSIRISAGFPAEDGNRGIRDSGVPWGTCPCP